MIPLALALVGGYLIGDSMKKKQVFAEGGGVDVKYYLVKFYITQEEEDSLQSALVKAESEREAEYKIADVVNNRYGKYLDYEVFDIEEVSSDEKRGKKKD